MDIQDHLTPRLLDLPPRQLRGWAQDPTTQALVRHLRDQRAGKIDSIVVLSRANPNRSREVARDQALQHAGAEELCVELINLINVVCAEMADG